MELRPAIASYSGETYAAIRHTLDGAALAAVAHVALAGGGVARGVKMVTPPGR
jgi:hypothetical protein